MQGGAGGGKRGGWRQSSMNARPWKAEMAAARQIAPTIGPAPVAHEGGIVRADTDKLRRVLARSPTFPCFDWLISTRSVIIDPRKGIICHRERKTGRGGRTNERTNVECEKGGRVEKSGWGCKRRAAPSESTTPSENRRQRMIINGKLLSWTGVLSNGSFCWSLMPGVGLTPLTPG